MKKATLPVTLADVVDSLKAVFGLSASQEAEDRQKGIRWYTYDDLPAPGDGETNEETGVVSVKRIPKHTVSSRQKLLLILAIVVLVGLSLYLGYTNFQAVVTAYDQTENGWQLKYFAGKEKQTELWLDVVRAADSRDKNDDGADGAPLVGVADFAVANTEALVTVHIGKDVREIGRWAFANGQKLQNIYVDPANEWFCDVDGVLYTKDMKTLLAYPMGREAESYEVPEGVEKIADAAFYFRISTDANQVAKNTRLFTSVTLPSTLREIGQMSFAGQGRLTVLELPEGLESIGDDAFNNCTVLPSKLYFPASLKSIGEWAFYRCHQVKDVYFGGAEGAVELREHSLPQINPNKLKMDDAAAHYNTGRAAFNAMLEEEKKEGTQDGR
ncbi:MAG: leucine-rich repeat domain-containing protein [Oscillospiraceae bacterium]|nr:leucine-rich repeat domain-containing protein [Oscillospiraceae bacterium]